MPQSRDSHVSERPMQEIAERVAEHAPLLLVYLDRDLRVRFANRHCEKLFGHAPRDILGRLLAELVDASTLKHALAHVAELERGNQAPREYVLRNKQGARKFVQVSATTDRDAQGCSVGYFACAGSVALGLGELVGSVVCEMSALAAERGVRLETSAEGVATRVNGDPRNLRQALARLVGAAIERSHPRSTVRIHVGENEERATFLVEDEGMEPVLGGHLGLCISRAIVERHGGTLRVANLEAGGASLHVELPRVASADAGDQS